MIAFNIFKSHAFLNSSKCDFFYSVDSFPFPPMTSFLEQICIVFGYLVMFAAALPVMPFILIVSV